MRPLPREAWIKRGLVALVVALLVTGLGVIPALFAGGSGQPAELNNEEYAPERIGVTAVPAEGEIEAEASGTGTVVIDDGHANRYDREDILPLVEAFVDVGYDVRFFDGGNLSGALADADAFLIIDPGASYDEDDVEAVQEFTDSGGRVAVLAEPNRKTVTVSGLGASITTRRSELTELGAAYEVSFRTAYIYNQERNDGNYKNVLASPEGRASDAGDTVALYTATRVVPSGGGEVVLRAAEGTRTSGSDEVGEFAVAVRTGNFLAVGDSTFITTGRYNVGDNEEFVAFLVEFLVSGDRIAPTDAADGEDS